MQTIKGTQRGTTLKVSTPDDTIRRLLKDDYIFRMGFYGRQGSGKSVLADTFPGKLGIVDADSGAMVYSGNVEYISINEPHKGNTQAYSEIEDATDYFGKKEDIKCIVFDSATAIFGTMMFEIQRLGGRIGQQATIAEYGKLRQSCIDFIGKAFGYGKHVIFIFHEQMEKDELSGRVWCNPMITGKLSNEIGRFFDEMYHVEPKGGSTTTKFQALTQSNQLYTCKSRIESKVPGVIPPMIDFTRPNPPTSAPFGLSKMIQDVKTKLKAAYPTIAKEVGNE
jgi:hypothetical protein